MPSPFDGLGEDNPLSVQADETAARRLDTGFATEVRGLVHDPATGLAGRDPEAALAGIPETIPLLAELKDRYLAQATGPRQKALLEPLIDHRLDRAGVNLGRIVHQATSVLDDRSVANRIADLQQDASLSWQDKAHLRLLGRTVVNELRYQGERKGWDAGQTDTAVRTGLSDLYAGAVEAAIVQDPERAATLYDHARVVIQPDRQAAVERKIQRANEERRVTEIVVGLADMPDDPTRRPDPDDYQARAAKATPADASPEVRAQVSRMAGIEHARADQAWQATRGRAATGALDWLAANPGAPLMAMPTALRDGLSPEQTEALDRTAMNGGRVVTDRDLYDKLDDQSVRDPESFAAIDLTQYRLSLGDSDYDRLTKLQKTLTEGKSDPAFERHRLGRLFLEEGLRAANLDPNGEEARSARRKFDRLLGAFESIEGKPPTMADIRGLVGDVLPRGEGDQNVVRVGGAPAEGIGNTEIAPQEGGEGDPNIVRVGGGEQVDPNGITQIAPPQETTGGDDVEIAQQQEAQNRPPAKPPASPAPAKKPTPPQSPKPPPIGKQPVSKKPDKTGEQITLDSEQRRETTLADKVTRLQVRKADWEQTIRKPLPEIPPGGQKPLPDDWEGALTRINREYLKWTKAAAEKNGIPPLLLARLFYKESNYDKNQGSKRGGKGIAQLTWFGVKELNLNPDTFNYYDPKTSIDAGAALLGQYYREFKDWPKAVAAYNMGNTETRSFFALGSLKDKLNDETSTLLRYVFRGQPKSFDKP